MPEVRIPEKLQTCAKEGCDRTDLVKRTKTMSIFCPVHYKERNQEIYLQNKAKYKAQTGYDNPMKNPDNILNAQKKLSAVYGEGVTNISQIPGSRDKANKTFQENHPVGSRERNSLIEQRKHTYKDNTITGEFNSPEVIRKREDTTWRNTCF